MSRIILAVLLTATTTLPAAAEGVKVEPLFRGNPHGVVFAFKPAGQTVGYFGNVYGLWAGNTNKFNISLHSVTVSNSTVQVKKIGWCRLSPPEGVRVAFTSRSNRPPAKPGEMFQVNPGHGSVMLTCRKWGDIRVMIDFAVLNAQRGVVENAFGRFEAGLDAELNF